MAKKRNSNKAGELVISFSLLFHEPDPYLVKHFREANEKMRSGMYSSKITFANNNGYCRFHFYYKNENNSRLAFSDYVSKDFFPSMKEVSLYNNACLDFKGTARFNPLKRPNGLYVTIEIFVPTSVLERFTLITESQSNQTQ